MFTKNDLKTGMTVKTRNGNLYLVLTGELDSYSRGNPVKCNLCLVQNNFYMAGNNINDDLTYKVGSDYDIMEVYNNSVVALYYMFSSDDRQNIADRTLIWKRDSIDWTKVTKDTKVYVKNNNDDDWIPAYFNFYDYENKKVYVYANGNSSFTTDGVILNYTFAKLYEEGADNE